MYPFSKLNLFSLKSNQPCNSSGQSCRKSDIYCCQEVHTHFLERTYIFSQSLGKNEGENHSCFYENFVRCKYIPVYIFIL